MNIQDLLGIGNRRNKFTNPRSSTASINFTISSQQSAAERPSIEPGMRRSEIDRVLNENLKFQLKEAHNRIQEQRRQERQRPPRRVTGSLRVSNTDSIRRARQVRSRLIAKLQEVAGSDMHERARGATAMDIKLQINRVDQQMTAIRRRERAIEEERTTRRRDDTPEARRRRARDMQERRIYVRRDFLYHANKGGFDPNNPLFNKTALQNAMSTVAFEVGGDVGGMDVAEGADFGGADFNMEVTL